MSEKGAISARFRVAGGAAVGRWPGVPEPTIRLTVVLLALVLVHGGEGAREAKQAMPCAAVLQHVADEGALARVRGQDGDAGGRVAEQTHVHEQRHGVLGLAQVLHKVRRRLALAAALVVGHVDELVVVAQPGVGREVLGRGRDDGQVAEAVVAPLVQLR